jgi:predicted P-loop ATPase
MIKISVATGRSAETKRWKNKSYLWPDFVSAMQNPHITHERYAEYMAMSKKEQGKVKDVGGYICGYLNGGRRTKENIMYRSALTLDLDFAPYSFWDTFTILWDCAAILHSTHKHSRETPRYRLVVPLDRDVTPDEYVAIARKFASLINIEYFDPTTFDTNRLMFWPSVSKDGEYIFEKQNGAPLSADDMLGKYRDWRDISAWPFSKKVAGPVQTKRTSKQEDPVAKNNIVGYFCNAYDIHAAIEEFLPDIYEPSDENRYTYMKGSTASGVVTYDGLFAYSHHGTDPAAGKLCNAFDLVRIHKFGDADNGDDTFKSYKQMCDFCRTLKPVKKEIARNIVRDFDEYVEKKPDFKKDPYEKKSKPKPKQPVTDDTVEDWREQLDIDKAGRYENSAHNITLILRNDPRLGGRMRYDLFSGKKFVVDAFPWHVETTTYPRTMRDVDFSGLRNYIERMYGITAPQKIDDAAALELNRNSFHPVRDYFNSLEWDGVARIDTLLKHCFDVEDNIYTREVSRKWMVAAVSRVMTPGCKYDTILSLVGEEGTRKSSFIRKLGLDWFSDSITTVTGKESFEQLAGKLIIEIAEMSAFDKAESIQIKHYASKQVDSFRPAYGRETVDYPRQCVFVATSNNRTFLRDAEGNRRFWPVDVRLKAKTAGEIDPLSREFDALIPQLWAEAVACWRLEEPLTLSAEAERIADAERAGHVEIDARSGMVEEYLNMDVPEKWYEMPSEIRADYLIAPESYKGKTRKRKYACAIEIWCECFGRRKEDLDKRKCMELNTLIRTISGWTYRSNPRTFPPYGKQRYYEATAAA